MVEKDGSGIQEKMSFTSLIISQGWNPYRYVYDKKHKSFSFHEVKEFNTTYLRSNFNVLINGGMDVRFIKDECFDKPIIVGLEIHGKGVSLIYPRLNVDGYNPYKDGDEILNNVDSRKLYNEIQSYHEKL